MINYNNSYIYTNYIDKDKLYTKKIAEIINTNKKEIVNPWMGRIFTSLATNYKGNVLAQKAIYSAQSKGEILFCVIDPSIQLTKAMPFVSFTARDGSNKIFIDITRFVKLETLYGGKKECVPINEKAIYTLLISAFVNLHFINSNGSLPPDVMKHASILWASMFCKVLNGTMGLQTNVDRYHAYMYMCIKYFVINICEGPLPFADSVANGYIGEFYQGKKELNGFLVHMENVIRLRQMNPWENIYQFCYILFNEEVSNIRGIRIANLSDKLNFSEFLNKYIKMFKFESIMGLGCFPYFFMTVLSADVKDDMVNYRSLKDIIEDDRNRNYLNMMTSIMKSVR